MSTALGKPASDRSRLVQTLSPYMLGDVKMDTAQLHRFQREHKKLIVTVVHGGAISWLPLALAMVRSTLEHDPDRQIVATLHPISWKVPGLRELAITLSGAEQPWSFPELLEALSQDVSLDYYSFPESENCLYGDLGVVKPFRFHGFIELSIRTQVPMLLVAQKGSEPWYLPVDLSGRLRSLVERIPNAVFKAVELNRDVFLQQIQTYKYLNIPLPRRRIPLTLAFELYYPELFTSGLATRFQDRRRQLAEEGERIRQRMQALYDSLE